MVSRTLVLYLFSVVRAVDHEHWTDPDWTDANRTATNRIDANRTATNRIDANRTATNRTDPDRTGDNWTVVQHDAENLGDFDSSVQDFR
ncbi:MAG: hypothetical protein D6698_08505 [Gammaproteobacteria bacterium]|nr:MAG: hypothetical protein D6698_08505 [Gammaproteobacteria bacterium]